MKIVAIGDTHRMHRELTLPEGEVLIHVGDIMKGKDSKDQHEVFVDFLNWTAEHDFKRVVIITGNHDDTKVVDTYGHMMDRMGVDYLADSGCEIDGVNFWGSPWCTPCYGYCNKSEEDLMLVYRNIPENVDVLITHVPPWEILDESSRGRSTGSKSLLVWSRERQPKLHLFGHCHNSGGQMTEVDGSVYANVAVVKDWKIQRAPMEFEI